MLTQLKIEENKYYYSFWARFRKQIRIQAEGQIKYCIKIQTLDKVLNAVYRQVWTPIGDQIRQRIKNAY